MTTHFFSKEQAYQFSKMEREINREKKNGVILSWYPSIKKDGGREHSPLHFRYHAAGQQLADGNPTAIELRRSRVRQSTFFLLFPSLWVVKVYIVTKDQSLETTVRRV